MADKRSTRKGGRPPLDPSKKAVPMLKLSNGKKVQDTPANRKKYGFGPAAGPVSTGQTPAAPARPETAPAAPQKTEGPAGADVSGFQSNEDAARAVISAALGAEPESSGGSAGPGPAVAVSYDQVVKIVNMILTVQAPKYAMTAEEEIQIGAGLDAVIAKRWPGLKEAGPEFALTIALLGYVTRVFIMPMLEARKQ
jgi:hypothetical protein